MSARKLSWAIAAALPLAGCGTTPPPEPVLVTVTPPAPIIPDECDPARDPSWQPLPDADVRRSEGARNYRANAASMATLNGRRKVCWAGLTASRKTR